MGRDELLDSFVENFASSSIAHRQDALAQIQSYIASHAIVDSASFNIPNYYRLIAEKMIQDPGFTVDGERKRIMGLLESTFNTYSKKRDDLLKRFNILHAFE